MKRRRLITRIALGVVFAAVVVTAAAIGGEKGPTKELRVLPPPTAAQAQELKRAALTFAAANGDSTPSRGVVIGANLDAVAERALSGAEIVDERDVYLVRLEGDFVGHYASRPRGAAVPTGRFLLIAFDANTNEISAWGITNEREDLTQFGAVTPLLP